MSHPRSLPATCPAEDNTAGDEHTWLLVRPLIDPVVEKHGFPVMSLYVETVVLPILGPTSVLLLRRLGAWVTGRPDGVRVDLQTLAGDLGIGRGVGRNSPIQRSVTRLCQFAMAEWQGEALAVRTVGRPRQ